MSILRIPYGSDGLYEAIIFSMASDPKPDDPLALHSREGSIAQPHTRRVDIVVPWQLLEMDAGVGGIVPEELIRPLGFLLNLGGQVGE
jgi:hypothetical protein